MHEKIEKLLRYCAKTNCAECAVAGCPGPQAFLAAAAYEIEELRREYESVAASLTESVELVRKLNKQIEELQKQVAYWQAQLTKSMCGETLAELEKPRWIPVTEMLPEESEGLDWREEMMIRVTSVWCCDAITGTIEVRNRFQGKMTGNEYLDQYTKDTDWHWSNSWWEPTHWMPIVPLPEPPKEETT